MGLKQVNDYFCSEDQKLARFTTPNKSFFDLKNLALQAAEIKSSYEKILGDKEDVGDMHVYDTLPLPAIKLNELGVIYAANTRACNILKTPKHELIGKKFSHFISQNSQAQYKNFCESLKLTHLAQICEVEVIVKDNLPLFLEIHGNAIKLDDATIYQFIFVNITEKKVLEKKCDQLEKSLLDLQLTFSQCARINSAGGMVAEVMHELYQPLMVINTYLTGCLINLKNNKTDPKVILMLQKAQAKTDESVRMITGLKNFFLKGIINKSAVNINSIIKNVIESFDYEIREKNISLTLDLNNNLPDILLDRIQIYQALNNIIKNAIEALSILTLSNQDLPNLIVKTEREDNFLTISIQDNGPGIAKEHINEIFSPLFSLKPGGFGLGLSITKSIIEAHHGSITVLSVKGATKFIINLPYEVDHAV